MSILFLFSLFLFSLFVLIHLIITRIFTIGSYLVKAYCLLIILSLLLLKPIIIRFGFVNTLIIYFCLILLWNLYLTFFINLMNSISLRIMIEINNSKDGTLSYIKMKYLYDDKEILEKRINELMLNRFIKSSGNLISLSFKGSLLAKFLNILRKIFSINFYG